MNSKFTFGVLVTLLLQLQLYAQSFSSVPDSSGKCYARCLIVEDANQYSTTGYNSHTELREVIYEKDIDSTLIQKIQRALINRGYSEYTEHPSGTFTNATC